MVLNRPNCFDSNPSLAGNRPKILVQDQKSQNITDFTHDHQKSQRSKYKTGFELASSRLNSTWQLTQNITSNSKVIEMQNFSLKNIKTPISLWNQVIETLKWTWIQNKMCNGHLQIRICWKWKATDEKKKLFLSSNWQKWMFWKEFRWSNIWFVDLFVNSSFTFSSRYTK